MPRNKRASNVLTMPAAPNASEAGSRSASSPDPNDVARRAYEIYESRGRIDGYDVEDWMQAERELQSIGVRAS